MNPHKPNMVVFLISLVLAVLGLIGAIKAFLRGGLCTPLISGRAGTNQRVRVSVPLRKVFQTEVVAARARRLPSSDFFSTRTDASALSSTTLKALSGARRLPLEIAL